MAKLNSYFKRLTLKKDSNLPKFIKCFGVNPITKQVLIAYKRELCLYLILKNKIIMRRDYQYLMKDDLKTMEVTHLEAMVL